MKGCVGALSCLFGWRSTRARYVSGMSDGPRKVPARAIVDPVAAYVKQHRDQFAGEWLEGEGDDRRSVIAFVGDLEPHRAALARISPGLEILAASYSYDELESLREDVLVLVRAREECQMMSARVDQQCNRYRVRLRTPDPESLRTKLARRFGDRVVLQIEPPQSWSPRMCPFNGWIIDETGHELTVTLMGGSGSRNYELDIVETPSAVEVRVLLERSSGPHRAVGYSIDVHGRLSGPLGTRSVIDMVAGKPREPGRRHEYTGSDVPRP